MNSQDKSHLHELKQKWKAARNRWLHRCGASEEVREKAWAEYEAARDVYFQAKSDYHAAQGQT